VDADLPDLPTLVARFPQVASGGILAVATDPDERQVVDLVTRGVMGVVHTASPAEELITAIRAIAAGYLFVPPRFLPALAYTVLRNPRNAGARELRELLTDRELDVLMLLASGSANRDIADKLGISVTTVRSHVLSILRKMNVPNRTMAAISAYRSGLTGN
jgi:DNA-binding NarL/FixJ family response regulator